MDAEIQKQFDALRKKLEDVKSERDSLRRSADEDSKRAASEKDEAIEKLRGELSDAGKRLEQTSGKLSKYVDSDKKTADELYRSLPKEAKARADIVKDKMDVTEFLSYLKTEKAENTGDGDTDSNDKPKDVPSFNRSDDRAVVPRSGLYKPRFPEFLSENFYREPRYLKMMKFDEDARNGERHMVMPMNIFRKILWEGSRDGIKLTDENNSRRKGR